MKTYRVIWRLLRSAPGASLAAAMLSVALFGLPVPLGLVTRTFFDALTGGAPAGINVGSAIALFVVV